MKLFAAALIATFAAVALTQETAPGEPSGSSTRILPNTSSTTTTTTTTTTEPATTAKTTTTSTTTTTEKPKSTTTPKPFTTTEIPTTSTTPKPEPPKHKEATLGNYTVWNGEEICAYVLMKVTVTQNTTQIPFVNGTLMQESYCKDEVVDMWIRSVDGEELEVTIRHDKTNFYVEQLSVRLTSSDTANIGNLTQFSTPLNQFYKCSATFEVSLGEQDIKVIFSDMKYQAFKKTKTAEFVGKQLECVSDNRSDVAIIGVGCALALLVVVILVAYLIARRRNRQRGYQSV